MGELKDIVSTFQEGQIGGQSFGAPNAGSESSAFPSLADGTAARLPDGSTVERRPQAGGLIATPTSRFYVNKPDFAEFEDYTSATRVLSRHNILR